MRILIGADYAADPNSGAAGTVYATTQEMRNLGIEVDEFWSDQLPHRIAHWNLHYLLELPGAYARTVRRFTKHRHYDVIQLSQPHAWKAAREHREEGRKGVFVNRSHGLESLADAALQRWHRKLGVPGNRFPNSLFSPWLRKALHRHVDLVCRYADGLIVPASDIRDHLVEHHGADPRRVAVIHHGVPDAFLDTPQAPMTPERARRILYVGQYSFIKGPQLLARAASQVLREAPYAEMTWVCGAANHPDVRALFDSEVRDRLTLLDWMEQRKLIEAYDHHGIHMAHSIYEGAAKTCVEAMARGQVVVSSSVGALKDHIRNGVDGFLVQVGDTEGMVNTALRLLADVSKTEAIANAASRKAESMGWRSCATAAVDFYVQLLQWSKN